MSPRSSIIAARLLFIFLYYGAVRFFLERLRGAKKRRLTRSRCTEKKPLRAPPSFYYIAGRPAPRLQLRYNSTPCGYWHSPASWGCVGSYISPSCVALRGVYLSFGASIYGKENVFSGEMAQVFVIGIYSCRLGWYRLRRYNFFLPSGVSTRQAG